MKSCLALLTTAAIGVLGSMPALAADAPIPGTLWETTTQMQMAGMGMSMPARTQQACLRKDSSDPPVSSPPDSNCQMTDVHRSGSTTTWKMRCTGKQAMTGDGEITYQGQDSYSGHMTMVMDQGTMTMNMSGKRLGGCDASAAVAQVAAIQKQSGDAKAQACASQVSTMQVQTFDGTMDLGCAPKYKTDFCKRLATEEGYDMVALRDKSPLRPTTDLESSGTVCGVNPEDVRGKLCKNAQAKNSLSFLARHCPDEAAPLAKAECAARAYTGGGGVKEQYREFCTDYARHNLAQGGDSAGASSGAAGAAPDTNGGQAPAAPADSAIDKGKKAFKKLFPF